MPEFWVGCAGLSRDFLAKADPGLSYLAFAFGLVGSFVAAELFSKFVEMIGIEALRYKVSRWKWSSRGLRWKN